MHFSTIAFALTSALIVSAANVTVIVGDQNKTVFNPPSVTVNNGDIVTFMFQSKNHSVTQSTFANPCQPMTTPKAGIDSGFHLTAPNSTEFASWSFTVDDASTPLWFFCAQTVPISHCQNGMVFAVNPTADKSYDAFLAAAKGGNAPGNTTAPGAGTNSTSNSTSSSPTPSGFSTIIGSPTGSAAPDTTSAAQAASSSNGALPLGGNAATLLTVVGLVAGLVL